MRLLKTLLTIVIIAGTLLGLGTLITLKSIQPTASFPNNTINHTLQESEALQTTLKLRLAKEAVGAIAQNKDEIILALSQEELDTLIRAQLLTADTPQEIKLLGSSFAIDKEKGNLQVALRLMDKLTIGVAAIFSIDYQNDYLIFYLDSLKLGRFKLPDKTTTWLLQKLAQSQPHNILLSSENDSLAVGPQITLGERKPVINPTAREIHFPLDFVDDNLTLTNIYFAENSRQEGLLSLVLSIDSQSIQSQIIEEIKRVIPPHLIPKELLPYL